MICKTCNTMNSNDAEVCVKCNSKLTSAQKPKTSTFTPKKKEKQVFKTPKKNKSMTSTNLKDKFNIDTSLILLLIFALIFIVIAFNLNFISFDKKTLDEFFDKYSEIVITADIPSFKDNEEKEKARQDSIKNAKSLVKKKVKTKKTKYIDRVNRKMQTYVSKKDSMKMILIPASGRVSFGSNDEGINEKPLHKRVIQSYYIDEHEVTNSQYRIFIEQTGHALPTFFEDQRFNAPNQPVVGVTYKDALAYASWAGKRLPTEYEWEKAARGGIKYAKYPYSNEINPSQACYDLDPEVNGPTDVQNYKPNDYGLYDMSGNVYEWTSSLAAPYPGGKLDKEYNANNYRIVRGGSWKSVKKDITVSKRKIKGLIWQNNDTGFRCVMDN